MAGTPLLHLLRTGGDGGAKSGRALSTRAPQSTANFRLFPVLLPICAEFRRNGTLRMGSRRCFAPGPLRNHETSPNVYAGEVILRSVFCATLEKWVNALPSGILRFVSMPVFEFNSDGSQRGSTTVPPYASHLLATNQFPFPVSRLLPAAPKHGVFESQSHRGCFGVGSLRSLSVEQWTPRRSRL